MFCVAVLLATAVRASPIDADETEGEIVSSEIAVEPENEAVLVVNDEQLSEDAIDPEEPSEVAEKNVVEEENVDNEESVAEQENVAEETIDEVIEDSEGEAVPYQQDDDDEAREEEPAQEVEEAEEEEVDEKLSQMQWERIAGVEIPLCAQHTDEQHPLLLR